LKSTPQSFSGFDQAVEEVPWRERVIEQNLFAASISVTLGFSFPAVRRAPILRVLAGVGPEAAI
jgi:hypothetical protein